MALSDNAITQLRQHAGWLKDSIAGLKAVSDGVDRSASISALENDLARTQAQIPADPAIAPPVPVQPEEKPKKK